jgi:hypothetical protein
MRTRDQAVIDVLRQDAFEPALMLKMTRVIDSLAVGFTSADKKITFGGIDYLPDQGLTALAFSQRVDFSTDNQDVAMLTSDLVTEGDLRAGLWNDSEIEFFTIVDRSNLSLGTVQGLKVLGYAAKIEDEHAWKLELRGYGERLAQPQMDFTSIQCRNRLGNSVCRLTHKPAVWAAATAYTAIQSGDRSVGSYVRPTTYTGLDAECISGGTSHATTEPVWPPNAGQTIVDNGCTWRMYESFTKQGTVTLAYDRFRFEAGLMTDPADRFRYGKVTWLTGLNAGFTEAVRHFETVGAFTLVDEMPFDILTGDTFEAEVGCPQRISEDCIATYDNVDNFVGEWALPGSDEGAGFPNAR